MAAGLTYYMVVKERGEGAQKGPVCGWYATRRRKAGDERRRMGIESIVSEKAKSRGLFRNITRGVEGAKGNQTIVSR